jgi:large subunit ribosomal protein L1
MEVSEIAPKVGEALEKKGNAKFRQSVEVVFNFEGVEMEGAHKLNLQIQLPKGRGKDVEIGVFADGDMNVQAKKHSKHVLSKGEFEDMAKDKRQMRKHASQCYNFLAQADLMAQIGKSWGIVLGPRGKMPQPVPPQAPIEQIIRRVKDTVRVKSKKLPTIHVPVGSQDMSAEDIAENIIAVYTAVERVVPRENIGSLYVKATMGSAVRVW